MTKEMFHASVHDSAFTMYCYHQLVAVCLVSRNSDFFCVNDRIKMIVINILSSFMKSSQCMSYRLLICRRILIIRNNTCHSVRNIGIFKFCKIIDSWLHHFKIILSWIGTSNFQANRVRMTYHSWLATCVWLDFRTRKIGSWSVCN